MDNSKNVIKLVIATIIVLSYSCKKKAGKETKDDPPPPTEEPALKVFLPIKLTSDKLEINFKYLENTSKLIEVTNSDGYAAQIIYKEALPKQIQRSRNNKSFRSAYYQLTGSTVSMVSLFDESDRLSTPAGHYYPTYNLQNQITGISYYNTANQLFANKNFTYTTSGNIAEFTTQEPPESQGNSFIYTYDLKNGIFKHVKQAQLLFPELGYLFFNPSLNNVLSYSSSNKPLENLIYSYEYNADEYPSKMSITTKNNSKQTYRITYKALQP